MQKMKHSISKKLILPVAVILLTAMVVMFVGSYHVVSHLVRRENDRYALSIVGIYSDMVLYEVEKNGLPLAGTPASDAAILYGEYICAWYRVDYAYMYFPHPETGTVTYLALTMDSEKFPDRPEDYLVGQTVPHVMSDAELRIWQGEGLSAVVPNHTFENALDTVVRVDDFLGVGNCAIAGVAVSSDVIAAEIRQEFLTVAWIILGVTLCIIALMYFLIRKYVSRPAQNISRGMTEFITDGKRSDTKLDTSGGDEFAMIAEAFNHMTDEIDAYLNNIRTLSRDQEHRQAELEIASQIQQGFLPPAEMSSAICRIRASMVPARDVGGDLYDYLAIDAEHTLAVIADISGKGMAAAMFMAVTLTLIRQFAKTGQSPAQILRSVNGMLSERNPNLLFATAFVAIYDSRAKTLTYANAGHNPPYLFRDGVHQLDGAQNTLLGLFPDEEYTEESIPVGIGDTLFLYTDGVNEAVNGRENFFGNDRLEETLKRAAADHERDYVAAMARSVRAFTEGAEQHDDITMLAFTTKETRSLELAPDAREFAKIRDVILSSPLTRALQLDLCVAAEECFVNICSYAFEGRDPAGETVRFDLEVSDRVVMRFTDGGMAYDPRENVISAEDYDMETQIGGLGKLIAFTVADEVDYEYTDRKNILTITKYRKESNHDDHQDQ